MFDAAVAAADPGKRVPASLPARPPGPSVVGRLTAAAFTATTVGLLISDVPGDDPAVIASGPTVPEASTPAQALAALANYHVPVPPAVRAHLETSPGCPGPHDPRMARVRNHVIAAPQQSLEAA